MFGEETNYVEKPARVVTLTGFAAFAQEAANLLGQRLLAVYVIGSLAGGSYRPGQSDIDTLLILSSDCAASAEDVIDALRKRVCAE